jgi:mono/diheme cytochrome c family protein
LRFAVLTAWGLFSARPLPPVLIRPIARAVVVLAALAVSGCRLSEPPEFRLNLEGRDPKDINRMQTEAIVEELEELFGTPDHPTVPEEVALNLELLEMAAGPIGRFEEQGGGAFYERGLYRQHCALCHGITGDGAGPLATILDPYPRDLRNGLFKYTSTLAAAKPTQADLERTLEEGNPGTGMPSFVALDPLTLTALIEYTKYLSIRGETELYLIRLVVDEDEYLPLGVDAKEMIVEEAVLPAAESWMLPERFPGQYVVVPPPPPPVDIPQRRAESIGVGRGLYASTDSQCVKCHGPEGDGNGEEKELYDDWNKPKKGVTPQETRELARRFTLPIQRLRARDFHQGTFRGGGRPEDLYWRVHLGIKGTPMPVGGPTPGAVGPLSPDEIWHVVHYLGSLGGNDH